MNTPHIGITYTQRNGLRRYRQTQREADRIARIQPAERRHGAIDPPPLTRAQLVKIGIAWCVVMGATLWLCTDAGMSFLVALWGAS